MSANLSRRRLDGIRRKKRMSELTPFLVPGWLINPSDLRIVATLTVFGFCQRGQEMLLNCRRRDCHRRVEIDFQAAVKAGKAMRRPAS